MEELHNILIITDAPTQPLYNPRIRFLYKSLIKNGVEVDCYTEQFEHIPSELNFKLTEIPFYKYRHHKLIGKMEWIIKNILNLLFDYKNKYFAKIISEYTKTKHYDLVFCSTFHTFGLRAAAVIANKKNIPLHIDLRDMAEQCNRNEYSNKLLNNFSMLGKRYKKTNIERRNKIIRQADSISSVSPWHVKFLKQLNPNVHLIYNGYDNSMFYPKKIKTQTFDIIYTGRWYSQNLQDPTLLLQALAEIDVPNIRLIWYTKHDVHKKLQYLARLYNVKTEIVYNDYIPNSKIPDILHRASILLVLTNINTHGIMTTKFFEALGVEKPVLCVKSDEGCLTDMIKETGAGLAATNVIQVKEFILHWYNEWKLHGYTHVNVKGKEQFSRQTQAKQFLYIFNSLTVKK